MTAGVDLVGAATPVHAPHGLPGWFREQVGRTPDAVASEDGRRALTYRELDDLSDGLADRLNERVGGRRGCVMLRLPRGNDLLVALLATLKAGCWYAPIALDEPDDRIRTMVATAEPIAVIGDDAASSAVWDGLPVLSPRAGTRAAKPPRPLPAVAPDDPVYVLFTSGSTGTPKAVLLGNIALCNRIQWMARRYPLQPRDRVLQKTPYTFDVSGWEFFWPITVGARCVFAPEGSHRDPQALLELVEANGITVCHFVPSMLDEFLRSAGPGRGSSLRHVFCSGEALTAGLARRFLDAFPAELHNLYGPTEAAIDVTHWTVPRSVRADDRILIGGPVDNTRLRVADADGNPVPTGEPGELWLGGIQLAQGYLGRPDLTARAFPVVDGRRYYRTGDIVQATDGGLAYLGRADDQVKVRGVRVEPGEVEAALARHPAVGQAVVVAVDAGLGRGTELLAAVSPADGGDLPSAVELRAFLAGLLPPAYLPSGLRWTPEIPLGRSGKADRGGLRESLARWWAAELDAADGDPVERLWWSLVARPDGDGADTVGFLELGGHSLLAARLIGAVADRTGVRVPVTMLLRDNACLAQVAAYVRAAGSSPAEPAAAVVLDGRSPLAPGQRRLWLSSRLRPDSGAYNVVAAMLLPGAVDPDALRVAFGDVLARHDALRARVVETAGQPELRYEHAVVPDIEVVRSSDPVDEAAAAAFAQAVAARPIDLATAPLCRVGLLASDTTAGLVVSLHHMIADQRSLEIVLDDLALAYAARARGHGPDLEPAPNFEAYAEKTAGAVGDQGWRQDIEHWKATLHDAPREIALPFRADPVDLPGFRGALHRRALGDDLSGALGGFLRAHSMTPAAFVLACVSVVLSRWAGQDCVVLGLPASRRGGSAEQDLVGFLVDTLPIRIDLAGRADFADLLTHVRDRYVTALQHNGPSFDAVVAELGIPTRPNANPVFQVWVNDLSQAAPPPAFAGLAARPVDLPRPPALFDLNFYFARSAAGYRLDLVRALDGYPADVADALVDQCVSLMGQVVADAGRALADYRLAPSPGGSAPSAAGGNDVVDVVERVLSTARSHGDRGAVVDGSAVLTYRRLVESVDEVASRLRAEGVGGGVVVELRARRSSWLPVALLGIWRADGVAAIVDGSLPPARLAECGQLLAASLVVHVGDDGVRVERVAGSGRTLDASHILFTSGTTGVPAGVVVERGALNRVLQWYTAEFRLGEADRVALLSGVGHDPVLRDVLAPLATGGAVVVPHHDVFADPGALFAFLADQRVTVLHTTPALLTLLAAAHADVPQRRLPDLRLVVSGGAPLTGALAAAVRRFTAAEIVNAYGTTETPQIAACHRVGETDLASRSTLPVGLGVAGAELAVVDAQGRPAAPGERGEIVVRGNNLAAGYLDGTGAPARFVDGRPRSFRTGDIGRTDPTGRVHVYGRWDRQVLVNGFRLEPAEIESAAVRHPAVLQAVVATENGALGDRLALRAVIAPGETVTADALRRHLRSLLPSHAVPSVVEIADRIDTDANHKPRADTAVSVARPQRSDVATTPWIQRLTALLASLLGGEVAPDDNFFDLGLNSISLLNLHALLQRETGGRLPVTELFTHTTVRSLAGFLQRSDQSGDWDHKLARRGAGRDRGRGAAATRRAVRARIHRENWGNE